MTEQVQCNVSKYYKSKILIKIIILWDILRVLLPMFFFVISLIMYVNDKDSTTDKDTKSIFSSHVVTPSPGEGSDNINDQLTTLSVLIGEVFRTLIIAIMGIYAFYTSFSYIATGTYFWTRAINSVFNIASHLFIFLVLGANIFTLIVTSAFFIFDMYLNYIVYVYWQNLKQTKNPSTLNSELSDECSNRVPEAICVPNLVSPNGEENKEEYELQPGEVDDMERNIRVPKTVTLKANEEIKQSSTRGIFPPIKSKKSSVRDDYTKATNVYDDVSKSNTYKNLNFSGVRKESMNDAEVSSMSRDPGSYIRPYNSTHPGKKNFFTSGHIQMIERSPKNSELKVYTLNKPNDYKRVSKQVISKSPSENNWVRSDKGKALSVSDEGTKDGREVKLLSGSPTGIKKNASNLQIDTSNPNSNPSRRKLSEEKHMQVTPANREIVINSKVLNFKNMKKDEPARTPSPKNTEDNIVKED